MMKRSKRLVAAIVASLSLFSAFPGTPSFFAPAVAEAEATGPLFMENLGWGLPLRVYETYSGPEWMTIKRHFPGIMFKGKFERTDRTLSRSSGFAAPTAAWSASSSPVPALRTGNTGATAYSE